MSIPQGPSADRSYKTGLFTGVSIGSNIALTAVEGHRSRVAGLR
jgi:hypothetical protein